VNNLSILRGADRKFLRIPGVCTIRPITLREIDDLENPNLYYIGLALLTQPPSELLGGCEEEIPVSGFQLIMGIPRIQDEFVKACTFFCVEKPVVSKENEIVFFDDSSNAVGRLTEENFLLFQKEMKLANGITEEEEEKPRFGSQKAKELWGQMQRHKKNKGTGTTVEEIVSCVSALSQSYNLFNIWGLTIPQLMDQYRRIYGNAQFNVLSTRWAAWGKEDFDFSLWCK
jgi:hypothetical protein